MGEQCNTSTCLSSYNVLLLITKMIIGWCLKARLYTVNMNGSWHSKNAGSQIMNKQLLFVVCVRLFLANIIQILYGENNCFVCIRTGFSVSTNNGRQSISILTQTCPSKLLLPIIPIENIGKMIFILLQYYVLWR